LGQWSTNSTAHFVQSPKKKWFFGKELTIWWGAALSLRPEESQSPSTIY
jgi:hypothetical protein